ncbi:hypothetical protein MRB53_036906 [Persea americana]|nr:hypothetical protein MRB53_036906 [Persea americana]
MTAKERTAFEKKDGESKRRLRVLPLTHRPVVLLLRHRLQKGFLARDQAPKEEEMRDMAGYFDKLEIYRDVDAAIIRETKDTQGPEGYPEAPQHPQGRGLQLQEAQLRAAVSMAEGLRGGWRRRLSCRCRRREEWRERSCRRDQSRDQSRGEGGCQGAGKADAGSVQGAACRRSGPSQSQRRVMQWTRLLMDRRTRQRQRARPQPQRLEHSRHC